MNATGGNPIVEAMRSDVCDALKLRRESRVRWMRQMGIDRRTVKSQELNREMSDEAWITRVNAALREKQRVNSPKRKARTL